VGDRDPGSPAGAMISLDGRRLVISRTVNANTDIWTLDLGRGLFTRLTFDAAGETGPIWSPDGSRVVFY
jgi:Tol biopolymer transport system component